ncbi:unnamed protein product [Phytophthora lilii]|uniref:Unnamed protein product n=1 Tax=Phytophthora lilii TaxID=2077276 RepID=A0A9W6TJU7_9STRA|nr:unnamed protein product [Phytophthora lilii]
MKWSPDSRAIALQTQFDIGVIPVMLQRNRRIQHAQIFRRTDGPIRTNKAKTAESESMMKKSNNGPIQGGRFQGSNSSLEKFSF